MILVLGPPECLVAHTQGALETVLEEGTNAVLWEGKGRRGWAPGHGLHGRGGLVNRRHGK